LSQISSRFEALEESDREMATDRVTIKNFGPQFRNRREEEKEEVAEGRITFVAVRSLITSNKCRNVC